MWASKTIGRAVVACVALAVSSAVVAQSYPSRAIRMTLGFAAGGSTDSIARFYAQKMSQLMGVAVVVENKPGASQALAVNSVMTSRPDGYSVFLGSGSAFSQGPGVRKSLPYDPLKDFALIGLMCVAPGVIVVAPDLPVHDFREFVAYAKAHPAALNYGSSGVGSASHLQTEFIQQRLGLGMTHVPFKADTDIMTSIAEGSVQFGLSPIQGAMGAIKAGRVHALAITGTARIGSLPDVPSLAESGVKGVEGIDPYSYYGLAAPLGTPPAIVARLNDAINQVSRMPETVALMRDSLFAAPSVGTPESFRRYIQADTAKWKEVGKFLKVD